MRLDDNFSCFVKFKTIFHEGFNTDRLGMHAIEGMLLQIAGSRSTCWKVMLGSLPTDKNLWIESIDEHLNIFSDLLQSVSHFYP